MSEPYEPTPEQIAAATAMIRATWTIEEFHMRASFLPGRRPDRRDRMPRIIPTDGIELPDDDQ